MWRTPPEYRAPLQEKFLQRVPGGDVDAFFRDLGSRFQVELPHEQALRPHDQIRKFINDEVQYEIHRRVLRGEAAFTEDAYKEVLDRVIDATTRRAIELFTAWRGHGPRNPTEDRRNLRTDLLPYLSSL